MKKYTNKTKDNSKRKNGNQCRLANLAGPSDEIDAICRRKLPDGVIRRGILAGRESEIRQETLIMVLSGYLEGHHGYQSAKHIGDTENMRNEMGRCVAIALQICKRRMESMLTKRSAKNVPITEMLGGVSMHPSDWTTSDWPASARVRVVLRAADEAVRARKLSPMNAWILNMAIREGMKVQEISARINVTDNAVYQQLRRVRKVLPEIIENFELW